MSGRVFPIGSAEDGDSRPSGDAILTREVPGAGVAAFAGRDFSPGEVVIEEPAIFVSALAAQDGRNELLWEMLREAQRARRLPPSSSPLAHLGPLAALRDLGVAGCRKKLLTKTCGDATLLPSPKEARREVEVLRMAVRKGLLPPAVGSFPASEYVRLKKVVQLNGFRFNGKIQEGDPCYDVGEALFDKICRFNHSCLPNLDFDLSWSSALGTVSNRVTATAEIKAGDELNISYMKVASLPLAERQRNFSSHWGFQCMCPRCVAETSEAALAPADAAPRGAKPSVPPRPPSTVSANGLAGEAGRSDGDSSSEAGICWDDLKDPDDA